MALFTDGTLSAIDELLAYESSLLEVARTERIDLTVKLELARQEIGIELTMFLVERGGREWSGIVSPALGLKNVVVTEPLKKWHLFHTLGLVYRDAYNSQLNDRYQGKWKEYERRARWAEHALYRIGVGTVAEPLEQADQPALSSVAGPLPGATYYARAAWVNASGEEGSASDLAVLSTGNNTLLVAEAVNAPANARYWNLYAGLSVGSVTLQNDAPLPVGQAWTEPASGLKQGRFPGTGQAPESYLRATGGFSRG
jgi:hypothetical protein